MVIRRTSGSLRVFRVFMVRNPDGTLDVSGVISRECYLAWLELKQMTECDEHALKFRRTLTNHVAGTDGRCPLNPEEEAAMLVLFRKKQSWPCFPSHLAYIGRRYRSKGFHEAARLLVLLHNNPEAAAAAVVAEDGNDTQAPMEEGEEEHPNHHLADQPSVVFANSTMDNVEEIITRLSLVDRLYLLRLVNHLVTCEDEGTIFEIMRFMILARTERCRWSIRADVGVAQGLCIKYASRIEVLVMVMDMATKLYVERVVAQNEESRNVLGDVVGNFQESIVQQRDLRRIVLVISAAYHQPGEEFTLNGQELPVLALGNLAKLKHFNMTYVVDPCSFLLVMFGSECSFGF